MTRQHPPTADSLFTQVEVSPSTRGTATEEYVSQAEQVQLLRQLVSAQDRQNELLEELVSVVGSNQRQRAIELANWKQNNPVLSRNCRHAAEALSRVQAEFLESLTSEIVENVDTLTEGDFFLNEFVDRFGPRLAHLNGVLHFLSQLSSGQPNQQPAKT
jgi:hypothetical protein